MLNHVFLTRNLVCIFGYVTIFGMKKQNRELDSTIKNSIENWD